MSEAFVSALELRPPSDGLLVCCLSVYQVKSAQTSSGSGGSGGSLGRYFRAVYVTQQQASSRRAPRLCLHVRTYEHPFNAFNGHANDRMMLGTASSASSAHQQENYSSDASAGSVDSLGSSRNVEAEGLGSSRPSCPSSVEPLAPSHSISIWADRQLPENLQAPLTVHAMPPDANRIDESMSAFSAVNSDCFIVTSSNASVASNANNAGQLTLTFLAAEGSSNIVNIIKPQRPPPSICAASTCSSSSFYGYSLANKAVLPISHPSHSLHRQSSAPQHHFYFQTSQSPPSSPDNLKILANLAVISSGGRFYALTSSSLSQALAASSSANSVIYSFQNHPSSSSSSSSSSFPCCTTILDVTNKSFEKKRNLRSSFGATFTSIFLSYHRSCAVVKVSYNDTSGRVRILSNQASLKPVKLSVGILSSACYSSKHSKR